MCVIVHLPAGTMLTKEHLFNATHNNWHSWGCIVKADNRLMVHKEVPEKGNDPEVIQAYLEKHIDTERVLHLRHTTRGGTNEMNAQPFLAYKSDSREIWFCHNGTLYEYGSTKEGADDKSDTLDYVEKILRPALLHWRGEYGSGDYTSPLFWHLIMAKRWSNGSRGLFIANDLPVVTVGDGWKDYTGNPVEEGQPVIRISNNDYFEKLTRGPFFEAQQEEERRKRQEEYQQSWGRPNGGQNGTPSTVIIKPFRESDLKKSAEVLESIGRVYEDIEGESPISLENLGRIDYQEWAMFLDRESNIFSAALMASMGTAIHDLLEENRQLLARNARLHNRVMALLPDNEDEEAA